MPKPGFNLAYLDLGFFSYTGRDLSLFFSIFVPAANYII